MDPIHVQPRRAFKTGEYKEPARIIFQPARGKRGDNRVIRGGSWNNDAHNCRSAYRNNNRPDNRNHNLSFRLSSSRQRPDAARPRMRRQRQRPHPMPRTRSPSKQGTNRTCPAAVGRPRGSNTAAGHTISDLRFARLIDRNTFIDGDLKNAN